MKQNQSKAVGGVVWPTATTSHSLSNLSELQNQHLLKIDIFQFQHTFQSSFPMMPEELGVDRSKSLGGV